MENEKDKILHSRDLFTMLAMRGCIFLEYTRDGILVHNECLYWFITIYKSSNLYMSSSNSYKSSSLSSKNLYDGWFCFRSYNNAKKHPISRFSHHFLIQWKFASEKDNPFLNFPITHQEWHKQYISLHHYI